MTATKAQLRLGPSRSVGADPKAHDFTLKLSKDRCLPTWDDRTDRFRLGFHDGKAG